MTDPIKRARELVAAYQAAGWSGLDRLDCDDAVELLTALADECERLRLYGGSWKQAAEGARRERDVHRRPGDRDDEPEWLANLSESVPLLEAERDTLRAHIAVLREALEQIEGAADRINVHDCPDCYDCIGELQTILKALETTR